jgi:4-amino-4-deoxy-L-arabinose transferase-like glycosyltransferase
MRRHSGRIAAVAVATLGALAVWLVSTRVFPYYSINHDEAVYLQQAAMLLEGQLALYPPLPEAFRPWFFVADGGRLYPKYTPVPAAIFAAGKLLGGYRIALAGVGGGILALTYGVVVEAFDRRTGLLAATFVLASPLFLVNTAVFLPYAPTALLNVAFAFAYLRADRLGDRRWAALAGIAVGLAFFSRPYTAVLFVAPFLVCASLTLWRDRTALRSGRATPALVRQATTAALGLGGVALALAYNAAMTGSPTRFPYQAFGPLDGLGFGTRRLLGHEIQYTPELAVRANATVLEAFLTEWVAGGLLGAALAALGVALALRRGITARRAALAGVFVSVALGNVYFWGNYNILGNLSDAEGGLIAAMGPHYHYDLLLPTAAFAARGMLAATDWLRGIAHDRLAGGVTSRRGARVIVAAALLVGVLSLGGVSAALLAEPVADNAARTAVYERAYEPFEGGPPEDAVVFLPGPYGDWLNHPFQPLRNDPGFDGETIYALENRPFAVADAYPDRRLYRYAYRGQWAPSADSPEAARLTRVRDVRGEQVVVDARLGVPETAESVTVRIDGGAESTYAVAENASGTLDLRLRVVPESATLSGDVDGVRNTTLNPDPSDLRITAFVDYGAGDGFSYRLDLPIRTNDGQVRALSPRVERCLDARTCGGAAAHVPDLAPDGIFVRITVSTQGA